MCCLYVHTITIFKTALLTNTLILKPFATCHLLADAANMAYIFCLSLYDIVYNNLLLKSFPWIYKPILHIAVSIRRPSTKWNQTEWEKISECSELCMRLLFSEENCACGYSSVKRIVHAVALQWRELCMRLLFSAEKCACGCPSVQNCACGCPSVQRFVQ